MHESSCFLATPLPGSSCSTGELVAIFRILKFSFLVCLPGNE